MRRGITIGQRILRQNPAQRFGQRNLPRRQRRGKGFNHGECFGDSQHGFKR